MTEEAGSAGAPLSACLRGEISPQVAVARMLLAGMSAEQIEAALAARPEEALGAVRALVAGRADALEALRSQLRQGGTDQAHMGGLAAVAAFFDRLALAAPEAGVALYSLGDPALLAEATQELLAWLLEERLIWPGARVLDVGCGIGRVACAIADIGAVVHGVDVSTEMVAQAKRRAATRLQVSFDVTDGVSLTPGPWDLILFADSMPYIHQSGHAAEVIDECAAVIAPKGAIVILNLSYGQSDVANCTDATSWAVRLGGQLCSTAPFLIWDARAFTIRT